MNRLRKFFINRRGLDELGIFIWVFALSLSIVSSIFKLKGLYILSSLSMVLVLYRALSKNIAKRYRENELYLRKKTSIKKKIKKTKSKIKNIKNYKYLKCPFCGTELRFPRGKGKIKITCPKCKNQTIVRS